MKRLPARVAVSSRNKPDPELVAAVLGRLIADRLRLRHEATTAAAAAGREAAQLSEAVEASPPALPDA